MYFLAAKAIISGILIAAASELAKRYPGFGALIASLPLVSVLGMMWLWHDRPDATNMAAHSQATFWFVLPSLPLFLLIPWLLRHGVTFWPALLAGCALTVLLYFAMVAVLQRLGVTL
ncbi:DUF3147 family protein [Sphingobium cloacae]|uniref:Peptide ABC transporter permease n=1 Tax=Sphingobium cloacae TaxID=120107 RepID=A0A1E1F860_9SPHN|nr:DUF3147 family protein [Sphingobium cloacae]BAV66706.1 hypothetical protein SCLO_3000390 [Sphingobium cloacae]